MVAITGTVVDANGLSTPFSAVADVTTGVFWQGVNTVFPSAATTGPRIPRVNASGGAVSGLVSGKRFTGTVIPANGTILEDCEFVGNGGGYAVDGDGRTFTVRYSRFTSSGGPAAILGNSTVISCDISGWEDGIKTQGSGWTIRDNFIHGPFKTATSHNDGVSIQWSNSNGLIEQNRIEWTDTSEIFMQKLTGQIGNIVVRHNRMAGSDLPLRIEDGCTGCQAYENMIQPGYWGWSYLNSTVVHYGNIRPDGSALD